MRVAVLHNRKPESATSAEFRNVPEDEYEEYDTPETIDAIVRALGTIGAAAEPVVAERELPRCLDRGYDFVFNIAEGAGRRSREAIPAAVCELLGLPYTGSDPLTLAVTLDKSIARRFVAPDVPVARGTTCLEEIADLSYPVIVKPNDEGSSKGIRRNSYCPDVDSAKRQAAWLTSTYGCPVLMEEWLPGAEVTVAITGNGRSTRVLAMMEIGSAAPIVEPFIRSRPREPFIYSLEVKRAYRELIRYRVPPSLPDSTLEQIESYALRAYHLLGCRDIARLDFRLDSTGCPCFLECNPLPGLNPESSDVVIATRSIVSYDQLICNILKDAAARHGISV